MAPAARALPGGLATVLEAEVKTQADGAKLIKVQVQDLVRAFRARVAQK